MKHKVKILIFLAILVIIGSAVIYCTWYKNHITLVQFYPNSMGYTAFAFPELYKIFNDKNSGIMGGVVYPNGSFKTHPAVKDFEDIEKVGTFKILESYSLRASHDFKASKDGDKLSSGIDGFSDMDYFNASKISGILGYYSKVGIESKLMEGDREGAIKIARLLLILSLDYPSGTLSNNKLIWIDSSKRTLKDTLIKAKLREAFTLNKDIWKLASPGTDLYVFKISPELFEEVKTLFAGKEITDWKKFSDITYSGDKHFSGKGNAIFATNVELSLDGAVPVAIYYPQSAQLYLFIASKIERVFVND